jgi:hypothetical protein
MFKVIEHMGVNAKIVEKETKAAEVISTELLGKVIRCGVQVQGAQYINGVLMMKSLINKEYSEKAKNELTVNKDYYRVRLSTIRYNEKLDIIQVFANVESFGDSSGNKIYVGEYGIDERDWDDSGVCEKYYNHDMAEIKKKLPKNIINSISGEYLDTAQNKILYVGNIEWRFNAFGKEEFATLEKIFKIL